MASHQLSAKQLAKQMQNQIKFFSVNKYHQMTRPSAKQSFFSHPIVAYKSITNNMYWVFLIISIAVLIQVHFFQEINN